VVARRDTRVRHPKDGEGIMQGLVRRLVVIGAAAAAVVVTPVAAWADSGTGQEFGQHVSACARTMGFDGTHNPGMHQGFAGWEAMHDC